MYINMCVLKCEYKATHEPVKNIIHIVLDQGVGLRLHCDKTNLST